MNRGNGHGPDILEAFSEICFHGLGFPTEAHGDRRYGPDPNAEGDCSSDLCGVSGQAVDVLMEIVGWVRVGVDACGTEGITHVGSG